MPAYANSCPECCCLIYQDYFRGVRADYHDHSGTWDRDFGLERLYTSDTGALLQLTGAEAITGRGNVSVTVSLDTAGGSARLIGSFADTDNYLYAELTINGASSTFKLFKRVGGGDTQLGSTYAFTGAVDTDYHLRLCWDQTYATAILGSTTKVIHAAYTGTGRFVAMGASPNGGTAYFGDFVFRKSSQDADGADCPTCGTVGNCCNDDAAANLTVTFTHGGTPSSSTWTKTGMSVFLCPVSAPGHLLYGPSGDNKAMMGCANGATISGDEMFTAGGCENPWSATILSCWPFHAVGGGFETSGGAPFDVEITE